MWRTSLSAADRCDNIQKLKNVLEAAGTAIIRPQKTAIQIEAEAYNLSGSREAYDAACHIFDEKSSSHTVRNVNEPNSPGISIGEYHNCHKISSGLCSDVYRCNKIALKVITQTHNVEPHNPVLEIKILSSISHSSIIKLLTTFYNTQKYPILVFPYKPFTLADLLSTCAIPNKLVASIFHDIFSALSYLHAQEIIHRDVKPSNILLASSTGPAFLSDFGTAWHPTLSVPFEPPTNKYLEVGTTAYRAPETLFGNRAYDTSLDLWASGAMLAECLRDPPKPLFQSRDTSENGNQLGLILSMFQTLGSPTKANWPEACKFSTPPFEWYNEFPVRKWSDIMKDVENLGSDLVSKLIVWNSSSRLTATEALSHPFIQQT